MKPEELYQSFVGKDKVQPIAVEKSKGGYTLRYRENGQMFDVECEDRDVLDQILIEFGGRNPETCRAPDRFLRLDNTWSAEDLNELGHRVTKIELQGGRTLRSKKVPIPLPDGTGEQGAIAAAKAKVTNAVFLHLMDNETTRFTRSFSDAGEFDELVRFIFDSDALKDLKWIVRKLCTESRATGKQCKWVRGIAGDGTQRMVLELVELDGVNYTKCVRKDIFDAAGDMFDTPCKSVRVKKKLDPTKKICLFAAEDGSVDIDQYEAVK